MKNLSILIAAMLLASCGGNGSGGGTSGMASFDAPASHPAFNSAALAIYRAA